jgi:hypothetical protein
MVKTLDKLNSITFKAKYVNEMIIAGQKTIQMVVGTDNFLNIDIPNKANSREFTGNKNKAVKEMTQTLRKEPEIFRFKNLGIRMVASDIIRNGNEITIFFNEDEGIFNGGHTYEVLKKYGNSIAYVYVTVEVNLPKEKLVDISLALNMSKKLEDTSQGEKIGAHNWIKEVLPTESIRFKEGDKGEYPVEDILKVANLYKIGKGRKYLEGSFRKSLLRKREIVKENNKNKTLTYTRFLLPDIWDLYKKIRSSKVIQSNFPDRFSSNNELLQGMTLVFLYGIQYMTEVNKNNIPVWKKDYSAEIALKTCEKLSNVIGRVLSKPPYKDAKAEWTYRETKFQDKIKRIFADELM